MEQEQLILILESLLFTSGRPLRPKDLAKILETDEAVVKTALEAMVLAKKDYGIVLLETNGHYQLATNSKNSTYVKNFLNAELREKLTDATVEVLAIIAYRQPIPKAEIEAIRGVNSQYSLRNLLIRGLIEKAPNPGDARSVLYQTTTEFLMHLGLTSVTELPEFEKLVESVKLPQVAALQNPQSIIEPTAKIETGPSAVTSSENSDAKAEEPTQTPAAGTEEKVEKHDNELEEYEEEDDDEDEE